MSDTERFRQQLDVLWASFAKQRTRELLGAALTEIEAAFAAQDRLEKAFGHLIPKAAPAPRQQADVPPMPPLNGNLPEGPEYWPQ